MASSTTVGSSAGKSQQSGPIPPPMSSGSPSSNANLHQQAKERARKAFARLPANDEVFKKCVENTESLSQVIQSAVHAHERYKGRKSTRFVEAFQKHTLWLQTMSGAIDVAVQTQSGVACPAWAPIKYILQVSKDLSHAVEQILRFIQKMSDCLPRLEIYKRLNDEPVLQMALLEIFTDIVEFSVLAVRYLQRKTYKRVLHTLRGGFETEFTDVLDRVERHAKEVDSVAVATELLKASEFRAATEAKARLDLRIKCQKWIRPPNVRETHQLNIRNKLDGTCQWIQENETFNEWKSTTGNETSDRLLCVLGIPGCGKSILASSLVEALNEGGSAPLMFFFSSVDSLRESVDHLTSSLLWQVLESCEREERFNVLHKAIAKGPPTKSELSDMLRLFISEASPGKYCVIDGIDECKEGGQAVVQYARCFLEAHPTLKIVLLGQPQAFQVTEHHSNPTGLFIRMKADLTQNDINSFIRLEMADSMLMRREDIRDEIFHALQDGSDGMFLWVKLMTDDLHKSRTAFEMMDRLKHLPRGLENAYAMMFAKLADRLDDHELQLAQNVLSFTIAARRPLNVQEMVYLHGLSLMSETGDSNTSLDDYLIAHGQEDILQLCGGFVDISDGKIRLVHASLSHFVTNIAGSAKPGSMPPSQFRVDVPETHSRLASACIRYMGFGDYGYPIQEPAKLPKLCDQSPLIEYASYYSLYHLSLSGQSRSSISSALRQLILTSDTTSWIEHLAVHWTQDGAGISMLATFQDILFGDDNSEVSVLLKSRLKAKLSELKEQFGLEDERTQTLSMIVEALLGIEVVMKCFNNPTAAAIGLEYSETPAREAVAQQSYGSTLNAPVRDRRRPAASANSPALRETVSSAMGGGIDALSKQCIYVNGQTAALLKLFKAVPGIKRASDPLRLLIRMLLNSSMKLPIHAILGVSSYLARLGKYEDAVELCLKILPRIGEQTGYTAHLTHGLLGFCYLNLKKHHLSQKHLHKALYCREPRWSGPIRDCLDQSYCESGTFDGSAEFFYGLLAKDRERYGPDDARTADTEFILADTLRLTENYEESLQMFQHIAERAVEKHGANSSENLDARRAIGTVLQGMGKYEEAEQLFHEDLQKRTQISGETNINVLTTRRTIGRNLELRGKLEQAAKWCSETIDLFEKHRLCDRGVYYWKEFALVKTSQGNALAKLGKPKEAVLHYQQALEAFEKGRCFSPGNVHEVLEGMADAQWESDHEEAVSVCAAEPLGRRNLVLGGDIYSPEQGSDPIDAGLQWLDLAIHLQ